MYVSVQVLIPSILSSYAKYKTASIPQKKSDMDPATCDLCSDHCRRTRSSGRDPSNSQDGTELEVYEVRVYESSHFSTSTAVKSLRCGHS